jgi:hypothetical protein
MRLSPLTVGAGTPIGAMHAGASASAQKELRPSDRDGEIFHPNFGAFLKPPLFVVRD